MSAQSIFRTSIGKGKRMGFVPDMKLLEIAHPS
jgi:hypothetical protein